MIGRSPPASLSTIPFGAWPQKSKCRKELKTIFPISIRLPPQNETSFWRHCEQTSFVAPMLGSSITTITLTITSPSKRGVGLQRRSPCNDAIQLGGTNRDLRRPDRELRRSTRLPPAAKGRITDRHILAAVIGAKVCRIVLSNAKPLSPQIFGPLPV